MLEILVASAVLVQRGDGLETARHIIIDDQPVATAARAQSRTVYLNKNGVTLMPGGSDSRINRTSLVSQQTMIPPWSASTALWTETVTCLRQMFAPFDVHVTETDPGNVPHIEAVFGGSPSAMGLPSRVAGVSPFTTTCRVIENSMVFTFTEAIPQIAQVACEVMAQEIAHSYGLDHEMLAADPMTYLSYSGKRSFQNVLAECGESSARPCGVQGQPACRDRQNSYALLLERLGPAGTGDIDAPVAAIASPAHGATVDAGFAITASVSDDVIVKFAALSIDGEQVGALTAAPWTFTAPADLAPGKHEITLEASDGANQTTVTIEVTVRGPDGETGDTDDMSLGGCATGRGTGWLFGLVPLAIVARRRRR